jgi:Flp pilus assembly protein TadG
MARNRAKLRISGIVMFRLPVVSSIGRPRARFAGAEHGNIAVIFAIALVPVLSFVGAAVDYTVQAPSSMQAALDSTALMLSKDLSSGAITTSQISTKATAYFQRAVHRHLCVAECHGHRKMSAMQTAAKNLVDQLSALAKTNGDVYISIVPFAKDVNVGASNCSQYWGDFTDWDAANGNNTCTARDSNNHCTSSTWTPANHNTWTGCVVDRDQDYDTKNTAPTSANFVDALPRRLRRRTSRSMQVNTGSDPTSSVLRYCASSTDKFYLVTSASQTVSVFKDIVTSLSKLRVAR